MIQIEPKTRNFIGTVLVGLVIAGLMFSGLIPEKLYQPYVPPVLGAFFYHIIRFLNPTGAPEKNPTPLSLKEP